MLVLSRQRGEVILIGDHEVTVLGIRGDKVRLGINAPKDVSIDRKEVRDAKVREVASLAETSRSSKPG